MPPVRKVQLLPPELREFLKEELVRRGFGDYEALAEDLNFRLEAAGLDLRIRKSALAEFGAEHRAFVKVQEEAGAWAEQWMQDVGLAGEAHRHTILFQMITALAFKVMRARLADDDGAIDARELSYLGKMMKDVMQSSGIREQLLKAERAAQAAKLDEAVASQAPWAKGLTAETVEAIKSQVLGVAA